MERAQVSDMTDMLIRVTHVASIDSSSRVFRQIVLGFRLRDRLNASIS